MARKYINTKIWAGILIVSSALTAGWETVEQAMECQGEGDYYRFWEPLDMQDWDSCHYQLQAVMYHP